MTAGKCKGIKECSKIASSCGPAAHMNEDLSLLLAYGSIVVVTTYSMINSVLVRESPTAGVSRAYREASI